MKKLITLFLVAIGCGPGVQRSNGQIQNLAPQAFMQAYSAEEKAYLLDVRTPREYSSGHLEGSKMIDYHGANFQKELAKLDKELPVYVYCRSGQRSMAAAKNLASLGFTRIINMKGGIIQYSRTVKKP